MRTIRLILLALIITVIQSPHIAHALIPKSHFSDDMAFYHGWAIALTIEALIVFLSYLDRRKETFAVMMISSLFIIGYYFDDGVGQIDFTTSAILLFSLVMPFISMSLGRKDESVPDMTIVPSESLARPGTVIPKVKEKQKSESDVPSSLSYDMLSLQEAGHSIRQIAERTGISKSTVERMLKKVRQFKNAS